MTGSGACKFRASSQRSKSLWVLSIHPCCLALLYIRSVCGVSSLKLWTVTAVASLTYTPFINFRLLARDFLLVQHVIYSDLLQR